MDARQLQYFLAIVDHGTVHRAAEELFVAQPSVSQTLRSLERDLGSPLFHRTGRRLILTPSGEQLIEPARQVIRSLELARAKVEAVDGLRAGRLVLAAMPSQAVSPLSDMISQFSRRYPLVQVSVRAAGTPGEVESQLRTADVELGLVAFPGSIPPLDGIVVLPVETQRFILVAAPDTQLPDADPLIPASLTGQRLIVGQKGTGMRRAADRILAAAPGSRAVVEIEHREAVLPLVLNGVGAAVLSESWQHLARSAGAVVRELDYDEDLHVCLLHPTGQLSPAAEAFLTTTSISADSTPD
ncbi:LysR family transcriptional regulator [Arthrobacter sp. H14]|uniref:LysR family transcriptional regulator n=1 Tax=Arthrobacter sp. H14 TaxID=1312959 RepID=UPI000478845D|nr:LysR family transcriptional regulator [Arthrobacter sp. H14]